MRWFVGRKRNTEAFSTPVVSRLIVVYTTALFIFEMTPIGQNVSIRQLWQSSCIMEMKSIFDVKLRVGKNNWEKQSALSNKSLSGNLWPLCRLVSLISGSSKTGARSVGTFLLCFFFLRAVIRFAIKTSFKNKWMKFVVFCLTAKQMPMGRC